MVSLIASGYKTLKCLVSSPRQALSYALRQHYGILHSNGTKHIGEGQAIKDGDVKNKRRDTDTNGDEMRIPHHGTGIVHSMFDDISIPSDKSVGHFMLDMFAQHKGKQALINGKTGQMYTYEDLHDHVIRAASGLVRMGVRQCDVVSIMCHNCPEFVTAALAVMSVGAILNPLNPMYTQREVRYALNEVNPKVIIASSNTFDVVAPVATALNIKDIITTDTKHGCLPFQTLLEDNASLFPERTDVNPKDHTAILSFSSGTTGLPKGVMTSHYNLIANILQQRSPCLSYQSEVRTLLGVVPFFHMFGLAVAMLGGLYGGNKLVTQERFIPDQFLAAIQQHQIQDMETGAPLGPDMEGEIFLKGPQIMLGYYNNQKATQDALDQEGWFYTGDYGYYDAEGYFYISDRIKDLIKVKGFQVAPAELESLLLSHPDVADAAVVGVLDPRAGEVPRAFIVKKQHSTCKDQDIINFMKGQVAEYKELKGGVTFCKEIPKSPSGKILRRKIKEEIIAK